MSTVLLLVMLLTAVGVVVGAVAVAQRDAAQASDLAALSGAAARLGGQDGCGAAKRIAAANGAVMATCKVSGDEIDFVVAVRVEHQLALPLGLTMTVHADAQAGRLGPVG
jgi:secretion/DNA translocation related TadE-like protein